MGFIKTIESAEARATKWARYSARAIALIWAGWWTYFGVASGIGEELDAVGILVHATAPGLFFLALAVIPWKWEAPGGALLLLESLAVTIGYPLATYRNFRASTILFVVVTMALPPMIAGSLFLVAWRQTRTG